MEAQPAGFRGRIATARILEAAAAWRSRHDRAISAVLLLGPACLVFFVFVDFFSKLNQPLRPELTNVNPWFERVKARPSAAA